MSKKKNGKHISGDPRKNSKPMNYKGINKEKKPEILCSKIIYDNMVEKTSREIKCMSILYKDNPSSNIFVETQRGIEKLIRKTTDDDDLDYLASYLWSDSPFTKFNQCDCVCLLRMKDDTDPYCRVPYHYTDIESKNYSIEKRVDEIDTSRVIFFGKRDHYDKNSKVVVLVKKGRDLFKIREIGDIDLYSVIQNQY